MNNEFSKSELIKTRVMRVMELAWLLNPTATEQEITGDYPTVFVYFSGHVSYLDVSVHTHGWTSSDYPDYDLDIRLNGESAIKELDECINYLADLAEERKKSQCLKMECCSQPLSRNVN